MSVMLTSFRRVLNEEKKQQRIKSARKEKQRKARRLDPRIVKIWNFDNRNNCYTVTMRTDTLALWVNKTKITPVDESNKSRGLLTFTAGNDGDLRCAVTITKNTATKKFEHRFTVNEIEVPEESAFEGNYDEDNDHLPSYEDLTRAPPGAPKPSKTPAPPSKTPAPPSKTPAPPSKTPAPPSKTPAPPGQKDKAPAGTPRAGTEQKKTDNVPASTKPELPI